MQYLIGIMTFLTSLFLILLILIQRGRGGGLAGALGGMGGQSAFGTKAGDLFTRITVGVAAVWILLSVAAILVLNKSHSVFGEGGNSSLFSSDKEQESGTETKSTGKSATDGASGTSSAVTAGSEAAPAAPASGAAAPVATPGGLAPAESAPETPSVTPPPGPEKK